VRRRRPAARRAAAARRADGRQRLPDRLYRSDDAGATWRKVNNANPRPMYFSKVRIDPNDPDVVYLGGVGLHQSLDGGKTMATDVAASTHDDVHAIWINRRTRTTCSSATTAAWPCPTTWPRRGTSSEPPGRPLLPRELRLRDAVQRVRRHAGQLQLVRSERRARRAGIAITTGPRCRAATGSWCCRTRTSTASRSASRRTATWCASIGPPARPRRSAAARARRAGLPLALDTPLIHSPHDSKVICAAANMVFRSPDRGLTWATISPDLTTNAKRDDIVTMGVKNSDTRIARNDGIAAWPAIVSLAESPKRPASSTPARRRRAVGTKDAGKTWTNVFARCLACRRPLRVGGGAVTVRREHRVCHFRRPSPERLRHYVYASNDAGQTWRSIAANLKDEVARTLTEDLKNPDVLYLGTETGCS